MSQLYIRVKTRFYCHRKTVKLRAKIGNDAFWIPPRLWAYAAENQPDGDFSQYTSEELADHLGCLKYATSILQALKDCGFIDENGMIHDWDEHNGYHKTFAARAKTAAAARWGKKESPTPPKEDIGNRKGERGDKHCPSIACSIPEVLKTKEFEELWEKWLLHLSQKKKKPTPLAVEMQLKKMAGWGVARSIAALTHSIESNYQGVFEPNNFQSKPDNKMRPRQETVDVPSL